MLNDCFGQETPDMFAESSKAENQPSAAKASDPMTSDSKTSDTKKKAKLARAIAMVSLFPI